MRWIVMLAVMLAADAVRADEWTRFDTALEAGYAATVTVDWLQTRASLLHGGMELNPLLGHRPSQAMVAGYCAGNALLHAGVSWLLPSPYRTIWQSVTLGVEGHAVYRNYQAGVRIAF